MIVENIKDQVLSSNGVSLINYQTVGCVSLETWHEHGLYSFVEVLYQYITLVLRQKHLYHW